MISLVGDDVMGVGVWVVERVAMGEGLKLAMSLVQGVGRAATA